MSLISEFKAFIMRGNVMDLAVGVIIGGAFGTIVGSLTNDVIMPIVAMFGSADFNNYFIPLSSAVTDATLEGARKQGPVLAWGAFVTAVINFLILGFVIFWMVKAMNRLMPPPAPAAPAVNPQETLLAEIRDLLAKQSAPAKAAPSTKAAVAAPAAKSAKAKK
jgi:large conductance mechanosensitive channel